MDFRIKCALQHVFSIVPCGRNLNHFMQRHVSKNLPISNEALTKFRSYAERHMANYQSLRGRTPQTAFEIGSGWDLCVAICMSVAGCKTTASDIGKFASQDLIDDILRRLGVRSMQEIGVSYLAPYRFRSISRYNRGATRTNPPPDHSFDLITSTSVFEHVPPEYLGDICEELRRIAKPDAVYSFWIDYKDHWSYFDRSISCFNFYRFTEDEWDWYNPILQYQNRRRHSDWVGFFENMRFRIANVDVERESLPDIPLAAQFRRYSKDDLEVTGAMFTLVKS